MSCSLEKFYGICFQSGFVRVLENLGSPGKRPLVLKSYRNLLTSAKIMKCMEDSKEN